MEFYDSEEFCRLCSKGDIKEILKFIDGITPDKSTVRSGFYNACISGKINVVIWLYYTFPKYQYQTESNSGRFNIRWIFVESCSHKALDVAQFLQKTYKNIIRNKEYNEALCQVDSVKEPKLYNWLYDVYSENCPLKTGERRNSF